jgi:hypothetical protein
MDDVEKMAKEFFGFGRWSAPHWFIGLEQGGGDNEGRAEAFKELQSDGLCDCKNFHLKIGESSWHGENAEIQKTWGRLMRLLASFHGVYSEEVGLLDYQKNHWGMQGGDTCVIELLGLSAAGLQIEMDRKKKYQAERIEAIRRKLAENTPKTVVMYGFTGEKQFQEIARGAGLARGEMVEHEKTLFIYVDHPTRQRRGNTNSSWNDLGTKMRANAGDRKFDTLLVERMQQGFSKSPGRRSFDGIALGLHLPLNPNRSKF